MIRAAILACAPVALALAFAASAAMNKVDATQITCRDFGTQNVEQQKRTIAFLQGYARKNLPEDQVGEVAIGGDRATVASACAADPEVPVWQKVQQTLGDSAGGPQPDGTAGVTHAEPTRITCQQLAGLSAEAQRELVYWLDGYSRRTDPSAATATVVDLDRDVSTLTDACRATPNQTLWSALRRRLPSTPSVG